MDPVIQVLVFALCFAALLAAVGFILARWGFRRGGLLGIGLLIIGFYFLLAAIQWNLTPDRLAYAARANLASYWQAIAFGWPILVWLLSFLGFGIPNKDPSEPLIPR